MAFRNALKVTLLALDDEQPPSSAAEPALFCPAPAPVAATPALPAVAQEVAQAQDESLAATWSARAEALRAMADTLPAKTTRPLMPKIAALYDEFAREAGAAEQATRPPEAPPPEDLPAAAPPGDPRLDPRAGERVAFPRRSLPPGRRLARRRG